jgi:hypothetical protein
MTDTAPEIKVTLTAEDRGVAAAIKELGNQLSQLKQKQQEVAESSISLKNAFDAVISSAVILKVVEFGKEVLQTSLNIDRLSQKTGLSAGFLSTFSKAAEGSGVSTEQVSTSLGRLATNITKFQQGGTQAAAAMKALGISQADLKNLSPEQAIRLVTDRLGSMQNGLQKAAFAQQLMGRGGQALLPVLNSLAGDGFDRVTDAAKATGQYITDEMAANTLAAASSLNELEGAAKGAATQFEAGLAPAVAEIGEALKNSLQSNGASGFEALGEKAGTVLRYIALLFVEIGTVAGAVVATTVEQFESMWKQIRLGGETVAGALRSGSFKGAWDALKQGAREAARNSEEDAGRMRSIWASTGEQLKKNFQELLPSDDEEKKRQAARNAQFKPKGDGTSPPPEDNKADKARLAALLARLQAELALYKANNSAEEAANQEAYNEGLESAAAFFARKKQLAQAESDEQISILRRERAAVASAPTDGTAAAEAEQKAKVAKFDSEIAIAKVNATKTQGELDSQLFLAQEQHQKVLQGYQAEILKAQGLTYQAAIAQIQGEAAQIQRSLVQAGLTPSQVAALLGQIQQLKLSSAAMIVQLVLPAVGPHDDVSRELPVFAFAQPVLGKLAIGLDRGYLGFDFEPGHHELVVVRNSARNDEDVVTLFQFPPHIRPAGAQRGAWAQVRVLHVLAQFRIVTGARYEDLSNHFFTSTLQISSQVSVSEHCPDVVSEFRHIAAGPRRSPARRRWLPRSRVWSRW